MRSTVLSEFLAGKPIFSDVATEFIKFVEGAELVIHNAPFDVGFIDAELDRLEPTAGKLEAFVMSLIRWSWLVTSIPVRNTSMRCVGAMRLIIRVARCTGTARRGDFG